MKNLFIFISLISSFFIIAQETIVHKQYQIKRVKKAPSIDGVLNDDAWKNANIATDFVMLRPRSNEAEPANIKTEVKICYDDKAIYFGAYLHDDKVAEIPMEFQTRDNFGNADFFGIVLNPLNDGINQTQFFVMSTGNQNDAKVLSNGNEDWSWNAVWDSSVKVVDDGWIVEVKIPYSALRFPNKNVQTWGLNFHRRHQKNRDQYTWNFIDREGGGVAQYDGYITGIENIKPPVRLSFNPFITGATSTINGNTDFDWSAGLDIKYGLSENFTLDATLIPDFGQVAFDDVTLNLGPFEQFFSEQRAFFTEGTDLFGKGDFFYSRRIGNSPTGKYDFSINSNETITENPNKVDLLNAIKVSGRTADGLGLGFFNAITEKTEATIKNNDDDSTRKVVTEAFANYNVLVVDKQFNKNSSVTLVNTNVLRSGHFRDANVTGLLFDLKTKNSKYGIDGGLAMSNIYNGDGANPITGLEGSFSIGKLSGQRTYGTEVSFKNERYDKNDLGFMRNNNVLNIETYYTFRQIEPKGKFNNYGVNVWGDLNYLMHLDKDHLSYQEKSNTYTGNRVGLNSWFNTKKQFSFGFNINSSIGSQYDYFEPRVFNRFYKNKPSLGFNQWMSTDYSKKFAFDLNYFFSTRYNESRTFFTFGFRPRYRINNKFSVNYNLRMSFARNQKGYVNIDESDNIIFGNRDSESITNSIGAKFNFNTKSALSLSFRHFWRPVTYDNQFFKLEFDGDLVENNYAQIENNDADPDNDINHDINFNSWNLDLNFNWEFAPGSQLIALYRNSIFSQDTQSDLNFTDNLDNLFKEDILHNFSIKLIYYLDYNQAKNWL